MEKRVWIAIALSALVLFLYPVISSKFKPKPAAKKEVPAKAIAHEAVPAAPPSVKTAAQLVKEEYVPLKPRYTGLYSAPWAEG